MSRETCYRCFWPKPLCWCGSIQPMATKTHFVFLTHPKEWKQEKAATGRLAHLCLANSAIHVGVEFDGHDEVQALIADPANCCLLAYPSRDALNLSTTSFEDICRAGVLHQPAPSHAAGARHPPYSLNSARLVLFLLDATWALGRKMLRLSPSLQHLPKVMFTPSAPSRYVIKQQPHPSCLSTLETAHELLLALGHAGLDHYSNPNQMLALFDRMQEYQLRCASDPTRVGYRHRPYSPPATRKPPSGRSGTRRTRIFSGVGGEPR